MEQQNDDRLHDLAGKLASIRQVTTDIYEHASDHSVIDTATETFNSMAGQIRSSSARVTRAVRAGHPVVKTAAIAVAVVVGIYIVVHMFY